MDKRSIRHGSTWGDEVEGCMSTRYRDRGRQRRYKATEGCKCQTESRLILWESHWVLLFCVMSGVSASGRIGAIGQGADYRRAAIGRTLTGGDASRGIFWYVDGVGSNMERGAWSTGRVDPVIVPNVSGRTRLVLVIQAQYSSWPERGI
ncbi:hypothetical protein J3F84DRAFT_372502 [Trichoderma pleuroticola]